MSSDLLGKKLQGFTAEDVEAKAETLWADAEALKQRALAMPWWRLGKSAAMIHESRAMKRDAERMLGVAAFIRQRDQS